VLHRHEQSLLAAATTSGRVVLPGLVLVALVVGCGGVPQPTSSAVTASASLAAVEGYLLPALPAALEANPICAGVGLSPLTLRGALVEDAASVWAETVGPNLPVLWPRGYRARFEPDLIVVNSKGDEVARGGTDMSGGTLPGVLLCPVTSGQDAVIYVLPLPEAGS
jgi:hypothetical protein